jgi:glycosyltransferase involved in cell wall biosynthesis
MRILLVHNHNHVGGVPALMIALWEQFTLRGHACELFFTRRGPIDHQLPTGCSPHYGDLADLLRLVSHARYDVVHAAASDWEIGVSALRRLRTGAKLVITSHGVGDRKAYSADHELDTHWVSQNCDALVGCASWDAADYQRWTDLPVQVVKNGVDTTLFRPDPNPVVVGPPVVAWVGRGSLPQSPKYSNPGESGFR